MPRRHRPVKREILPDPVFGDTLVTKFINCMMLDGKRGASEKIFYGALESVAKKVEGEDVLEVFRKALENIKPLIETRSRRVGGSNYQIPMEVPPVKRQALAIRWLIKYARLRNEKSMIEKLAGEIVDAFHKRGAAIKKREDTHKMADANKAFAHFRF